MKRALSVLMTAALLAGLAPLSRAIEVVNNEKGKLEVYGRSQMIGVGEVVPDPLRDNLRIYLFPKQNRIGFRGQYDDAFKFDTQLAFGGEDTNGSNTDLGLLDFVADIPLMAKIEDASTFLKIGQFRVPYSREGITDRAYLDFGDRSIANLASYQSRDYGLALMSTHGVWTGTVGTFSSGGRNVPQRYLPERFGMPYVVTRFGYNDGYDEDIYHAVGTDINLKRTTKAVMFNAIYMQDTLIGHSSAIQARTADKNLLIDSGFNPYINAGGDMGSGGAGKVKVGGTTTLQRGNLFFVGADAGIRHPLGNDQQVDAEIEGNWGGYQNRYGVIHIANARTNVQYEAGPFGIGVRYGLLMMDKKSGFLTPTTANGNATNVNNDLGRPIHEITPALTWRVKGHNLKLVADLPVYLNCPIWYDTAGNLGAYAFPDPTSTTQNSLLATAGNSTARHTVVEGRMLFQFMF